MEMTEMIARAYRWTGDRVAAVKTIDLEQDTPCDEWDVQHVLTHLVADVDSFNRVLSGEPVDLMTATDPETSDITASINGDAAAAFGEAAQRSLALWTKEGAIEQTYKTSRSELPGAMLANICLVDTLVHGWDIAKATGQQTEMDADLAEAAYAFTEKAMQGKRMGFAEPVPAPADATPTETLVAWLGRDPRAS
jgi:uncharacterized protein (TIGR03086 family)